MTNLEIIAALAEHAMNWHREEPRKIPCWVTDKGRVVRIIQEWNPLMKWDDTEMVVEAMIVRGFRPEINYMISHRPWHIAWWKGQVRKSLVHSVSFCRATNLSALQALGIKVYDD